MAGAVDQTDAPAAVLYTPYAEVSVPPGQTVNYGIDLMNKSKQEENAVLSVEGLPRGWTATLNAGAYTIEEMSVLPGEKRSFNLKVDVPLKVNKGSYHFKVIAQGLAELPLTLTVSEQGTYKTELTCDQPNMQGNSKSSFTYQAKLKNETSDEQEYALVANAPKGWGVVFKANYRQATSAQVEPNATSNISIDIAPPANVTAGTYNIPVQAVTKSTSASLTLQVVITGTYGLELTTPEGLLSTTVTAGETKKIDLVVENTGSAALMGIRLSDAKPNGWEVSYAPSEVTSLQAGERAQVVATLKAAKKAIPGDYIVRMTVRTAEANASAEFRVTVRTSAVWGWLGILIIVAALGSVYLLFRKYGRR
jgi:uncharacterized membrane protein